MINELLDGIQQRLGAGWDSILYFVTLQFLDPFWWWFAIVVACYLIVTAFCAFVGFYFPNMPGARMLRTLGGFFLVVITFGLFAFAKGESAARAHDKKNAPKPKPPARPTNNNNTSRPFWPFNN